MENRHETIGRLLFFIGQHRGGGETQKGLQAITKPLPNLKHTASLLDRKHKDSRDNDAKIEQFTAAVRGL